MRGEDGFSRRHNWVLTDTSSGANRKAQRRLSRTESAKSLSDLRRNFMSSQELLENVRGCNIDIESCFPPQIWEANRVDSEASASQLALLVDRIKHEWEEFGRSEPHWSVLTHEKYRQDVLGKKQGRVFRIRQNSLPTFSLRFLNGMDWLSIEARHASSWVAALGALLPIFPSCLVT